MKLTQLRVVASDSKCSGEGSVPHAKVVSRLLGVLTQPQRE